MGLTSKIYNSAEYMREVYSTSKAHSVKKQIKADRDAKRPVMRWSGQRFEVFACFEIRGTLKKAGFSWDPAAKVWWTDKRKLAVRAIKLADAATREMILFFMTN